MYIKIKEYLSQFITLSEEQFEQYIACYEAEILEKNQLFVQPDEICQKAYFINEGIARSFYVEGKKEITQRFYFAGQVMTDFPSFLLQKPSLNFIMALTNMEVLAITYDKLEALYQKDKIWERMGRLGTRHYLAELEITSRKNKFKSATERYDAFIKKHPEALKYIPIGQIASFIGVSIETLSRIRSSK